MIPRSAGAEDLSSNYKLKETNAFEHANSATARGRQCSNGFGDPVCETFGCLRKNKENDGAGQLLHEPWDKMTKEKNKLHEEINHCQSSQHRVKGMTSAITLTGSRCT